MATQDKPHLQVPLLIKPATSQFGVVCLCLCSLLALVIPSFRLYLRSSQGVCKPIVGEVKKTQHSRTVELMQKIKQVKDKEFFRLVKLSWWMHGTVFAKQMKIYCIKSDP